MRYFRERFPLAEFVPDGIYSFVTGAKKPSPAMFAAFEADYGKPVLYIDDRDVCLAGAELFQWQTHKFVNADTLREFLGL
jgi:FMN phosphatase YigB (HAD superfamily)